MWREPQVGKKYNDLTVLKELPNKIINAKSFRMVEVRCSCGNVKMYKLNDVKARKSCGCKTMAILKSHSATHGLTNHPLFSTWQNMKNRCSNPKTDSYKYYGAKGVKVCDEWVNNFKSFYDWAISNGWRKGHQIDRFPNKTGNYEPANCRIATVKQNQNNKTSNVYYEFKGETKTLAEYAVDYNLEYKTLHMRIKKLKWNLSDALLTPTLIYN